MARHVAAIEARMISSCRTKLSAHGALILAVCTGCVAHWSSASLSARAGDDASGQSAMAPGDAGNKLAKPAANDHLPALSPCTSQAPAPRALRRLTSAELSNTVIDLFGDGMAPSASGVFSNDASIYGFHDVSHALEVRDNGALSMQIYAESVAAYAAQHLSQLFTCNSLDANCERSFVTTFGKRAFRRPLSSEEVEDYLTLFTGMPDFATGASAFISAVLQSPAFIYRSELGAPDPNDASVYRLTPYEVASELSYAITASPPDAQLMQAADADLLASPAQILAQAKRLAQTPRAHAALDEFFLEWLQVADLANDARTEDTTTLSASLKQAMHTPGLVRLPSGTPSSTTSTESNLAGMSEIITRWRPGKWLMPSGMMCPTSARYTTFPKGKFGLPYLPSKRSLSVDGASALVHRQNKLPFLRRKLPVASLQ
ncbi:MAG: DUF1592 domain-containing protein [Deltaproteobacteria bacterium]|nr:MAG: DUF1592 domain-containing protein [Deltaproteobacteria bacterium]